MPSPISLRNKRVTVMGLGRFRGGIAAARFAAESGAIVTLTDVKYESDLTESLGQLDDVTLDTVHLGGHRENDFRDCDLVIANPAVRPSNPFLKVAQDADIPITTEIALFWERNPAPVVAVTGSNGKSTTASLAHAMLQHNGRKSWLGGNIGVSLLPDLRSIRPDDIVVLELSSFQLQYLDRIKAAPHTSIVTNLSPNHLDWHDSMEDYRQSKQSIVRWQRRDQTAVLPLDDPEFDDWPGDGQRMSFGIVDQGEAGVFLANDEFVFRSESSEDGVLPPDVRNLPGEHNRQNIAAAACAAWINGAEPDAIRSAVAEFTPPPFRLQFIREVDGRRFYNDSIATTPDSVIAALKAFDAPIVLIAGGSDKGIDLSAMASTIADRVDSVFLMGQMADTLNTLIHKQPSQTRCHIVESLEAAVRGAFELSAPGTIILLSPGCASYGWFRDFEDRGTQFNQIVTTM